MWGRSISGVPLTILIFQQRERSQGREKLPRNRIAEAMPSGGKGLVLRHTDLGKGADGTFERASSLSGDK